MITINRIERESIYKIKLSNEHDAKLEYEENDKFSLVIRKSLYVWFDHGSLSVGLVLST